MVETGKLRAANDFLNGFLSANSYSEAGGGGAGEAEDGKSKSKSKLKSKLSPGDLALIDAVRRPLRAELEKVKVKQRMIIRQMMGLDPDVIPAAEDPKAIAQAQKKEKEKGNEEESGGEKLK